jgi:hypothetical protein
VLVTFRSSPMVLADTPMLRSTSTRILSGNPPRAMWSAAILLGLYRIKVFAHFTKLTERPAGKARRAQHVSVIVV